MKGLHSHNLDFEIIQTNSEDKLLFLDTSVYFETPESPLLEITLPGFSKYFTVNYQPNIVTVLTSNTIGLTNILENSCNSVLPDGVYKITQKICPYQYLWITKYHLRTTMLDCQINLLFTFFDELENPTKQDIQLKKDITDILIFLESAKANISKHNTERGQKIQNWS